MNRVWTEEELDILRRDRAAKVPIPVTAAKLGRPVPATYTRARQIGTLVQPHQSWDASSVGRLRELISADPPLTDRRIAEELGRTVTQVRWKLQDLGLTGIRDLSKLAKNIRTETDYVNAAKRPKQVTGKRAELASQSAISDRSAAIPTRETTSLFSVGTDPLTRIPVDPRAGFESALKQLEQTLAERLKDSIAEAEAGMVRAAMDAIAEKRRIDQSLADLGKQLAESQPERIKKAEPSKVEARAAEVAMLTEGSADELVRQSNKRQSPVATPKRAVSKPLGRAATLPTAQGKSKSVAPRQPQPHGLPPGPKIVVLEAPAPARPDLGAVSVPPQVSGRGGWKSVRRDPARVTAQAKATNRADAVDLAQAAQTAIERFIAERGVTRAESQGVPSLVSRLQSRGYIVVQNGDGWVVDQRHYIVDEAALITFAEARGISVVAAA